MCSVVRSVKTFASCKICFQRNTAHVNELSFINFHMALLSLCVCVLCMHAPVCAYLFCLYVYAIFTEGKEESVSSYSFSSPLLCSCNFNSWSSVKRNWEFQSSYTDLYIVCVKRLKGTHTRTHSESGVDSDTVHSNSRGVEVVMRMTSLLSLCSCSAFHLKPTLDRFFF